MDFLTSTTHLHITSWVITLVLFFVCALAAKNLKPVHMTLRLFYILTIITGVSLYIGNRDVIALLHDGSGMTYDMKFMFGILLIAFMEMVLVRKSKGKATTLFWVLLAICLIAVLYIGLGGGIGVNLKLY